MTRGEKWQIAALVLQILCSLPWAFVYLRIIILSLLGAEHQGAWDFLDSLSFLFWPAVAFYLLLMFAMIVAWAFAQVFHYQGVRETTIWWIIYIACIGLVSVFGLKNTRAPLYIVVALCSGSTIGLQGYYLFRNLRRIKNRAGLDLD